MGGRCALWGGALFSRLFQNAVSGASESVWCRACWAFRKIGESSPWTGEMVWGEREGGLWQKTQCAASASAMRCICLRSALHLPSHRSAYSRAMQNLRHGSCCKDEVGCAACPPGAWFQPRAALLRNSRFSAHD